MTIEVSWGAEMMQLLTRAGSQPIDEVGSANMLQARADVDRLHAIRDPGQSKTG